MSKTIKFPKNTTKKEIETAARALWNEKPSNSDALPFDLLGLDDRNRILRRAKAAVMAIRELYK